MGGGIGDLMQHTCRNAAQYMTPAQSGVNVVLENS